MGVLDSWQMAVEYIFQQIILIMIFFMDIDIQAQMNQERFSLV